MAHSAMNHTHVPPWRLRASATVTIRNQCAVEGRLKRRTIRGEKMSQMISVTNVQTFPIFSLYTRSVLYNTNESVEYAGKKPAFSRWAMNINEKQQNNQPTNHRHSWWPSLLVGYPLAALFAAGAFLIPWSGRSLGIEDYFVAPPFVMVTLLVGWIWGIGPALLALLLEVLALDYWIVPPVGDITFFLWPDIASFAPFLLIQLIVLEMIVVQKNDRQQLLQVNQALSQQARELAKSIQACVESNTQLEQADRVKDRFLSMASHELRTPVTSIHGYVQLLLRRFKKQSAQNPELLSVCDSLGKVDEQARRLVSLMNDLLDINSLRSGKMPFHLAPCDLCLLCREVVEECVLREGCHRPCLMVAMNFPSVVTACIGASS